MPGFKPDFGVSGVQAAVVPPDGGRASALWRRVSISAAALFMAAGGPVSALAQVTSVFGRMGNVLAVSGDYTCNKVTNCGRTNNTNTWAAQQTFGNGPGSTYMPAYFKLNFPSISTTGTPYQVVIDGSNGIGAASARTQTMLQIVGASDVADFTTQEVNVVDAFAYGGFAQYDAERYDLSGSSFSPVQNGETIGTYSFEPFDGTSDSNTAGLIAAATENQSNATNHHGTDIALTYTPNSDPNLRYIGLIISGGGLGGVGIGDAGHQNPPADLGKGTLNVVSDIATGGHFRTTGPAPSVSSCGTGGLVPGAASNDVRGEVFNGSGITSCTITFHQAYATAVQCMVQDYNNSTPIAYVSAVSTTSFTASWPSSYSGAWTYFCLS